MARRTKEEIKKDTERTIRHGSHPDHLYESKFTVADNTLFLEVLIDIRDELELTRLTQKKGFEQIVAELGIIGSEK